jgi:hypothetical protein
MTVVKTAALNRALPFEGICLELQDGTRVVGVVDAYATDADAYSVYCEHEVLARRYAAAAVRTTRRVALCRAPESTFAVTYQKTGSINTSGSTNASLHRRHVLAAEPERGRAKLLVVGATAEALDAFLRAHPDVHHESTEEDEDGTRFDEITTPGKFVQETIFSAAARHGLDCVSLAERKPTILPDTLFRSLHTFAQQSKHVPRHELGPTRDLWRFFVGHLPPHWLKGKLAPFTWEAYARRVFEDVPSAQLAEVVPRLPQPLRNHVLEQGRQLVNERRVAMPRDALRRAEERAACASAEREVQGEVRRLEALMHARGVGATGDLGQWLFDTQVLAAELEVAKVARDALTREVRAHERCEREHAREADALRERARALAALPPAETSVHYRCPALTEAQQEQALHLFHGAKFGAHLFDPDVVRATHAALLQYVLFNGTWPHLVTVYEQSRAYVGFGDTLRDAHRTEAELPNHVRNRCRKLADGRLVGAGGPGSKGIVHAARDCRPIYNPLRQHRRGLEDNLEMGVKRMRSDLL